jgi:DNA-binding transcriptional ArsR family regulator
VDACDYVDGHDMSSLDEEKIASELKGNTLRAYWALMNAKDGVLGVRELQRRLGFSSPALASYHLNKLADMKLVAKERGDYRLVREVKVGVLKQFIKLGTFLLPRYVLYATMFTTLLIYLLVNLRELTFYSALALVLGVLGTVIFWYETVRVWRQKP